MSLIALAYTLTNGQTADASQVMADLNAILAQANGNLDATDNVKQGEFLELLTKGTRRRVAIGSTTATWAGAVSLAFTPNIAHGLGTTPIWATGIPVGGTVADGISVTNIGSRDATNIVLRLSAHTFQPNFQPGAGGTTDVLWLAIG